MSRRLGTLCVGAALCVLPPCVTAQAGITAAQPQISVMLPGDHERPARELLLLQVSINGQPAGEAALLRLQDGRLQARREDWINWRLQLPAEVPLIHEGGDYWPLDAALGYTQRLDVARQMLALEFAAAAFVGNRVSAGPTHFSHAVRPDRAGAYLNYELVATYNEFDDNITEQLNGQFETVLFNPWGAASSQWVVLDLTDARGEARQDFGGREVIRLDSALRRDDQDGMQSLVLGDAIGKPGLWGRAARFGGVQWARNFATQPGFVSVPQPSLRGENALPSVLEVTVDGVRSQTLNVPSGPFVIDNIPAVNGLGEVQVVVRDLLGREQVLLLPYLSGVQQLKAGLHDYTVEAGFLREDFGRRSDGYGRFVATTQHQYGFNDDVTGEARLELRDAGGYSAGGGGVVAIPLVGVLSAAGVYSHEPSGDGGLGLIALQRTVRGSVNIGARLMLTTRDFSQTGASEGFAPPLRLLGANVGFPVARRSSLGLGYVRQDARDGIDTEALTANLSSRLWGGSLSVIASQRITPDDDLSLTLVFSMALGPRISGALTASQQRPGEQQFGARLQRSLPDGEGYGWNANLLQSRRGDSRRESLRAEAGLAVNADVGSVALEGGVDDDSSALRATAAGSVVAFGGHLFAARPIANSFAVVDTGVANVPLQLNNQLSVTSNAQGFALLPNVQAYLTNQLRAEVDDLPLDVEAAKSEAVITPYFRSGLMIPLSLRGSRSAVVLLLAGDGKPWPTGRAVQREGSPEVLAVGNDGKVFVKGVATGRNRLLAADGVCHWDLLLPSDAGLQPQLGPIACETAPQ